MKQSIIQVENLVQVYPDGTRAIDGISFSVDDGELFGFLGPNGAGKSTTIKILTTLLGKTFGSARVAGYDLDKESREIRNIIGVETQDITVDGDLTGRQNLILQGHLHRMRGTSLDHRVDELLQIVELSDVEDKKVAHYSGGMKKRLNLASALVSKPKLLFLDEPTVGLDPQSRAKIWKFLQNLNRDSGVTIFLTTQQMEEADKLCNRISIIDQGKVVATGSPSELKQQVQGDTIAIELASSGMSVGSHELVNAIGALEGVMKILPSDNGFNVYALNGSRTVPEIVRAFDDRSIPLTSIKLSSPSLDDVFLQVTGRTIRREVLEKVRKSGHKIRFH